MSRTRLFPGTPRLLRSVRPYLSGLRILQQPRLESFHDFQQFLRHVYCWHPDARKLPQLADAADRFRLPNYLHWWTKPTPSFRNDSIAQLPAKHSRAHEARGTIFFLEPLSENNNDPPQRRNYVTAQLTLHAREVKCWLYLATQIRHVGILLVSWLF